MAEAKAPDWIGQALLAGGAAVGNAITRGGPKRQYKYNKKLAAYQNKLNRENQQWLLEQQKSLTAAQLEYDSPRMQMARYKEAGLNPNLIYGQGTPGNMSQPVSAGALPGVNVGSVDAGSLGSLGTEVLAGYQSLAQTDLTQARTGESTARTEILGVQKAIAQANPMLDSKVAAAVSNSMLAIANAKAQEGAWLTGSQMTGNTNGQRKMDADLQALFNKNFLAGATLDNTQLDTKIKNKILESKEFENALKEIQVKWMKDADITPQHIYQGLMLVLSKMF